MTPYSVRRRVSVPQVAVTRLSAGSSVAIQASAQDPSQLMVDWVSP